MCACNAIICAIAFWSVWSLPGQSQTSILLKDARVPATSPVDTEIVRAEIRSLESFISKVPDRGAILFLLARKYAHLGKLQKALALLRECVALDAGFVPDHI